jgi:preprotein translocase subunit SecE
LVAKKEDDEIVGGGGGGEDEPAVPEAEVPPGRLSSSGATTGGSDVAAPRAARFGEGREGRGARRERGVARPRAGFFERTSQFLHDVRMELKRVTWPTAKEVRNTTIITIIAVIFFALYLWGVDHLFALLITQLQRLINWLFGLV